MSSKVLDIIDTISMMVMLAPTLEVNLWDITMSLVDFYYVLIIMDVISGLQGVVVSAEICLLGAGAKGHIYWEKYCAGYVVEATVLGGERGAMVEVMIPSTIKGTGRAMGSAVGKSRETGWPTIPKG